ncbi:TPA: type I-E CRISPR-associated protein Cas6/Cse3/CasE [Vibrio vulnificus]|uniref:Type I-E CRISPR-associated protein Cas6/Cse3/CasE n=1 Tax=Vibrio vulnificus TaxID=672 RepID=A0A8H9K5J9_VIBVL|nr:type I-E CRISPR-associated protein Cas6/Cse3/CasE [Vibrio vulnificus]HAS8538238.1 type I-E CRISPR-associated protein Cas6/Cse3/CasE [Vibrio vulnificus]
MKVFENTVPLRRIKLHNLNSYVVHSAVEKIICGNADNVLTSYTYDPKVDVGSNEINVLVRSMESTGLPGEREIERNFSNGDVVEFEVNFVPIKTDFQSRRKVYVSDSIERAVKLHSYLERAGLDVDFVEEIIEEKRFFNKKDKHKFFITSVLCRVVAKIKDKASFEKAYVHGLGKKCTFGYGMIHLKEIA